MTKNVATLLNGAKLIEVFETLMLDCSTPTQVLASVDEVATK